MKVLVTGATGFLGHHLCQRLIAEGHKVRILVRPTSDLAILENLPFEKTTCDVCDPVSLRRAVQDQDWVIHAAADLSYWRKNKSRQWRVNVDGTHSIASACRLEGVERFLHISSVAAIGIPKSSKLPANEDFSFNLKGTGLNYHISKQEAEQAVMAEVRDGLNAVIVNPASIFGPHGDQYRGAEMIQKVQRTRVVPYFKGGICAVHVEDVVGGILAALKKGICGHRYVLGGENITYRSIVERSALAFELNRRFVPLLRPVTGMAAIIFEAWGHIRNNRPRITYATHFCASSYHYYDSSKAIANLGYAARDFQAILDECIHLGVC